MARPSGAVALAALLLTAATLSASALPTTVTTGAPRKVLWTKDLPADPFCPWQAVKVGACAAALGLVDAQAGASLGSKCCELVSGLVAAEAAACLCVAAKESALGGVVTAEWSVGVELLASTCKKELPDGFKCV
uniref:Uncharacterized protein n=1 Tax=Avena sativa TaxID=4498 RepID=A0ACD5V1Q8_AVESA